MVPSGLRTEQEYSEHPVTFRRYSEHPPTAPALVRRDSTLHLCCREVPSKVRSRGTLPQHSISCGRPMDQKLFDGLEAVCRIYKVCEGGRFLGRHLDTPWEPPTGIR